jgi:hypothetical protein
MLLNHRTAVYGPVRTVVWEGTSREAPPIPITDTRPATAALKGRVEGTERHARCRRSYIARWG